MTKQQLPWWQSDTYDGEYSVPQAFEDLAGPEGYALVKAWPDGRTDAGWGLQGGMRNGTQQDGFWPRYNRKEFLPRRVLYGFDKGKWAFAFVMRSVRLVCIDIDGKNGGLEHAKRLGALTPTLAETSKSGDGYHLFYEVEDSWADGVGYGLLGDRIGIEQGVDFRGTGCVYHYAQQRWNAREPAMLPGHLKESLLHREQKLSAQQARISSVLAGQDEVEVLMMQDEILRDLAKPIQPGKRNNTLFAIGNKMKQAEIDDWQQKLLDRAQAVGLGADEADKLVANIEKYAVPTP